MLATDPDSLAKLQRRKKNDVWLTFPRECQFVTSDLKNDFKIMWLPKQIKCIVHMTVSFEYSGLYAKHMSPLVIWLFRTPTILNHRTAVLSSAPCHVSVLSALTVPSSPCHPPDCDSSSRGKLCYPLWA